MALMSLIYPIYVDFDNQPGYFTIFLDILPYFTNLSINDISPRFFQFIIIK